MKDFDVYIGTGDIPTNELNEFNSYKEWKYTEEEIQNFKDKGYLKDSTGRWYNPNNYIDSYYADW